MPHLQRLSVPQDGCRYRHFDAGGRRRYDKDWIEAQLSHAGENKIRGTYNHAEYVDARRDMMQGWADWLDSLV